MLEWPSRSSRRCARGDPASDRREEEGDCDNPEEDGYELEQALPDEDDQIAAVSTQRQSVLKIANHALVSFLPRPESCPRSSCASELERLVVITWEAA